MFVMTAGLLTLIEGLLLVIWGSRSHTEGVHGDVLAVWRRDYATIVRQCSAMMIRQADDGPRWCVIAA